MHCVLYYDVCFLHSLVIALGYGCLFASLTYTLPLFLGVSGALHTNKITEKPTMQPYRVM